MPTLFGFISLRFACRLWTFAIFGWHSAESDAIDLNGLPTNHIKECCPYLKYWRGVFCFYLNQIELSESILWCEYCPMHPINTKYYLNGDGKNLEWAWNELAYAKNDSVQLESNELTNSQLWLAHFILESNNNKIAAPLLMRFVYHDKNKPFSTDKHAKQSYYFIISYFVPLHRKSNNQFFSQLCSQISWSNIGINKRRKTSIYWLIFGSQCLFVFVI